MYEKIMSIINGIFDKISLLLFKTKFNDSIKHIVLLYMVNFIIVGILSIYFSLKISLPIGASISLSIGYLKEKFDKKYTTGFSGKDIFMNTIGVFVSSLIIIIIWG